jgi:nitrite reductase/ring-hydroxylating ferredoxin subunit
VSELDVERILCRLSDIENHGARGFTIGRGDWPLRGFIVRIDDDVRGYVNRCPHAGHPLNLGPNRFLTPGGELILCASHGALFDRQTGFCIAGPCSGQSLTSVPLKIEAGYVMLGDGVDVEDYADRF